MNELELQLTEDYGSLTQKIVKILLTNNNKTLNELITLSNLPQKEVFNILALLIQKRIIKYFEFSRKTYYKLDRPFLYKRLYFSLYLEYVEKIYGDQYSRLFYSILCSGIVSDDKLSSNQIEIIKKLLKDGIVNVYSLNEIKEETKDKLIDVVIAEQRNIKRTSLNQENVNKTASKYKIKKDDAVKKKKIDKKEKKYILINFKSIERKIFLLEMAEYLYCKYNESMKNVFISIIKCKIISIKSIISNLDEKAKVLIKDKSNVVVNDISNIDEYLKYLENKKIIYSLVDDNNNKIFQVDMDVCIAIVKKFKIQNIIFNLHGQKYLRVYNLIVDKIAIEDRNVIKMCLLNNKDARIILTKLFQMGFIFLKTVPRTNESTTFKASLMWEANLQKSSFAIITKLKYAIKNKLCLINKNWDGVFYTNSRYSEDIVHISEVLGRSKDMFILDYF